MQWKQECLFLYVIMLVLTLLIKEIIFTQMILEPKYIR